VFELAELGDRSHDVLGGAMQLLQSRNAPETEQEPELIFRPANRSFFDIAFESSVNPGWLTQVQESYGVCFEYFDMNHDLGKTKAHINDWVADQTNDMIPELVNFLPVHVSLVLVNALYFKASSGASGSSSASRSAAKSCCLRSRHAIRSSITRVDCRCVTVAASHASKRSAIHDCA